ncbi:MAG: hypothetical protein ACYSU3_03965 [Planctomycetota bacterium]
MLRSRRDDSARVGVGGSERDDNTFNGEATSWQWSRGTDFDLGNLSAGTHTIQIRRREDGFCVDRVMIADDWSKLPSDGSTEAGPAESPTGGDPPDTTPPAAPTRATRRFRSTGTTTPNRILTFTMSIARPAQAGHTA